MILDPRTPRWIRIGLIVTFVVGTVLSSGVLLVQGLGVRVFGLKGPIQTGRLATDEGHAARLEQLPRIFVPNPAIESMVRTLAGDGDRFTIYTPWREIGDGDPAYWKPTADEIREIQACAFIFLNGAGYEPWAAQSALPRAKSVDTTAELTSRLIVEDGGTHSHGPDGEHSHSGFASSTWLSPELAKEQLATVVGRLSEALGPTVLTRDIYQDLCKRLDEGAANLRAVGMLQPKLLASHPVYQYLGQAGGIAIDSMHWEPGEMPSEKEWTKFRLTRAAHPRPTAWMLWEGEPGQEIRARLDAEGVKVFVFPLFPERDGDFMRGLPATIELLQKAVVG